MAKLATLELRLNTEAAVASIGSLGAAIDGVDGLRDRLVEAGDGFSILGDDLSGLFRCEVIGGAAARAGELHGLRIVPDQRYIELVSAVTCDGNPYVSGWVHDWPILSFVSRDTANVAETAGESILGGGGAGA